MNERTSLTEFINGFKEYNLIGWVYKIPDIYPSESTRFIPPKPFDLIIVWENRFMAIEAKAVKNCKSFAKNKLKEHQLENLDKIIKNGFEAYLLVFNLDIRPHEAYLITLEKYKELDIKYLTSKSIKLSDIKKESIIFLRKRIHKKYIYDWSYRNV